MQDPDPLPWGALDRFQAHFIVKKDSGRLLLETMLQKQNFQQKVILQQRLFKKLNGLGLEV